jgi:predicted  nucleic acid-binding Zn-ribbon protein
MRPRELAEFRRLIEKKGGLAVVRVVSNSCSACHVKVRPAAMQILKAGSEIIYCDSCRRILYYDSNNP